MRYRITAIGGMKAKARLRFILYLSDLDQKFGRKRASTPRWHAIKRLALERDTVFNPELASFRWVNFTGPKYEVRVLATSRSSFLVLWEDKCLK